MLVSAIGSCRMFVHLSYFISPYVYPIHVLTFLDFSKWYLKLSIIKKLQFKTVYEDNISYIQN